MDGLSLRINGQADYRPAGEARAAWREEMLDQLLSRMREHQLPEEKGLSQVAPVQAVPGKGAFVDIYV